MTPRIAITPGEPAGIGPDVVISAAAHPWDAELVAIASASMLRERAELLGSSLAFESWAPGNAPQPHQPGTLKVLDVPLAAPCAAGKLDSNNATYVISTLEAAVSGCQLGDFSAMVTAPVQKSVINEAGIPFSGHTEWLAEATKTKQVVMMLAADKLRVALATTHLPLQAVPEAITAQLLESSLRILNADLHSKFGIASPRISVLGLNPHAGEDGHLGREELDIIIPTLEKLRAEGMDLLGPLPADTAFNPKVLENSDAYYAMYHDQGLPVLKYAGFGQAINITLGLPLLRVSVDHGTALDLAGSGQASPLSLNAAIGSAIEISQQHM